MVQITVKYGLQVLNKEFASPPTVADIKRDSSLRMALGYGDNIKVLVGAVEQPDYVTIPGGMITIETAANTKN